MAKSKTPQLKKSSPTATKIRTAERRKLARESAREEARRQDVIRRDLRRTMQVTVSEEEMAVRNRVVRGLGGVLRLVASSYPEWDNSVTFAVELNHHDDLTAFTDWKRVVVRFPRSKFVVESDGNFNNEVTRSSIAQVLGVGYHEVGHVLYTVPYITLRAEVANVIGLENEHQQSWNALEDQRMEVAVTDGSPDIASYFTAMFVNHFLDVDKGDPGEVWWLACGRLYLPEPVRVACRDEFVSKYGEDVEDQLHTIVKSYCTATTLLDLAKAVLAYDSLWKATHPKGGTPGDGRSGGMGGTDHHQNYRYNRDNPERAKDKVSKSAADGEKFDKDRDPSPQGGEPQTGSDGPPSGNPGQGCGKGSDEQPERSKTGQDSKTEQGSKSLEDTLKDAKAEAEQANDTDGRVDSALNSIKEATASGALPYVSGEGFYMADDDVQRAESLATEFERALEVANAYNAPSWRRRQEQGAVDAAVYRTRRPGDPEFRRIRTGDGSKGYDVAVSLLLDVSGSMGGTPIHTLSIVQYAIKRACWSIGIPCTVTAFSNAAEMVSDAEDAPEPFGLDAGGGTNPVPALRAALGQRREKKDQLVILLTDGQCEDGRGEVSDLQSTGAHVLGVAVGYGSTQSLRENLGCDDVRHIEQCEELAVIVEEWLTTTVSVGR